MIDKSQIVQLKREVYGTKGRTLPKGLRANVVHHDKRWKRYLLDVNGNLWYVDERDCYVRETKYVR